jgi:hypothetical protein
LFSNPKTWAQGDVLLDVRKETNKLKRLPTQLGRGDPLRRFLLVAIAGLSLVVISAATAGTNGNKTGQACYKGQYLNYIDPSTGTPFANQDACVMFVAHGGTLTSGADVGLTFTTPSSTSISNDCPVVNGVPVSPCLTGDVSAHNAGAVPVTLTIHLPEAQVTISGTGKAEVGLGSAVFTCTNPPFSSSRDCTGTVAAGATAVVVPVLVAGGSTMSDSASITASSVPDPNPSNNSVSFTLSGI